MENIERRVARRLPVSFFLNKYVDGVPSLCEAVELSMSGTLIRRVLGPDVERASYALELAPDAATGADDARVWLCAVPVWRAGAFEALRFVGQSRMDRLKLASLLDHAA
jgi:hypothetical protein